ncbi:MAG: RND transporter [Azoarcus sp.]|nr:MAG: RND transporter [Azoarcus sp.]
MPVLRISRLAFYGLCTGLAACASPPAAPPDPALPAAYTGLHQPAVAGAAVPNLDTLFADPHLRRLIQTAIAHNRDLKLAAARVAEAAALYDIQEVGNRPGIELGVSGTRSRTPADLSLSGRSTIGGQYRAGATLLLYEIDFWGRVRSLNEAALAQYLASHEARQAFETSLVALVANTHLQAREFEERIALARKTLISREESYRIMRRRTEVGASSDLELRQVESLLVSTRGELAALEREAARNGAVLAQLVGHQALPTQPPLSLAEQGLEGELPPGLPAELLTRRPDIRAAEQRLSGANASIRAARAAFLPNITLTGFAGASSAELDGLFQGGSGTWSFTPALRLPLFDGGRTQANLNLAEAHKLVAIADYEATIQNAFREVAEALAAQRWLAVQVREQTALVTAEAERARLAGLRFERGASSYLDVLDAERALFAAEQALVQLRRARMSSTVNLYRALGGHQAGA